MYVVLPGRFKHGGLEGGGEDENPKPFRNSIVSQRFHVRFYSNNPFVVFRHVGYHQIRLYVISVYTCLLDVFVELLC